LTSGESLDVNIKLTRLNGLNLMWLKYHQRSKKVKVFLLEKPMSEFTSKARQFSGNTKT